MSEGSKHKKDDRRRDAPREGSVAPEDDELTTWLHRLWARKEFPERIELWPVSGPRKMDRGRLVHHEDFKPNDELNVERCNKLANELMAAAHNECNGLGRDAWFEIAVIDHNRRATPLARLIGPLKPDRAIIKTGASGQVEDDLDDDGISLNVRSLDLLRIKEANDQAHRNGTRNDRVIGDLINFMGGLLQDARAENATLRQNHMTFFLQLQDALDRSKERERAGAWTDMKVEMARDGLRAGRNLIFGFFGPSADKGAPKLAGANGVLDNLKEKIAIQFDKNSERSLIDGFLNDCERAGILTKLFGEWTEQGPVRDKPGIFSFEQAAILVKVRDGELPPEVIDQILPGMGGAFEISFEQISRAQPLIPEGMGQALIELKELRERRRAAMAAASPAVTPQSAPAGAQER